MILTKKQIQDSIVNNTISIDPFDRDSLQPASYDLKLGSDVAITDKEHIINLKEQGTVVLRPGHTALVLTDEIIKLDNQHIARFGLISSLARAGLIASVGPQIDPGFEGKLVFTIRNISGKDVVLLYRDFFVTVEFHKLNEPTESYKGFHQKKTRLTRGDIEKVRSPFFTSYSEVLKRLDDLDSKNDKTRDNIKELRVLIGSLDKTTAKIASSIKWLQWTFAAVSIPIIGIFIAIIVTIFGKF